MSAPTENVVRFAATLLPAPMRDRYREQWLGELRDAEEVGIPRAEIAMAALTFAASLDRPFPRRRYDCAELIVRRTRLAIAFSLSSALLGVGQFAMVASPNEVNWAGDFFGFIVFAAATLLPVYAVLAPVVALVLAFATRGVAVTARVGVALLAAAAVMQPISALIYTEIYWVADWYLTPRNLVYPSALILIVVACVVLWNAPTLSTQENASVPRARRLRYSIAGALCILTASITGYIYTQSLWAARPQPVFSTTLTEANRAEFEEWVTIKVLFELFTESAMGIGLAAGCIGAVALVASGFSVRSTPQRSALLSGATFFIWLVYFAAVLDLLSTTLSGPSIFDARGAALALCQWLAVAAVFALLRPVRVDANTPAHPRHVTLTAEPSDAVTRLSAPNSAPAAHSEPG